ncbi:NADP-dependent oxidoreductase [Microbacterium sp. CFBP9034]|uniref:NADP-dependent oxidoreductase n=1 Tax=Microbacterium sp. CFBP9034 TaxID=3096540 RepID=UPI002A69D517|nr:NADP-dependent oxidoreductase [Microbacterium sp. CFBP9034]MDY0910162.1 NADP-dependent oxidoreductase [Microbacterium sp. CFBP9034]
MKAQVLNRFGDPDVFELTDVDSPAAGPGEVLVRVAVAAVNPLDAKIRSGAMSSVFPTPTPAILGSEIAGVVEATGADVTEPAVGERVVGFAASGGYAELVVTTPDRLAVVPSDLSLTRAATIPTAAETAQRALALIGVQPGETVVVNAAAGSVGSAAVQLLVSAGARVIGTASADNHDYVRALGATPVRYGDHLLDDLASVAPHGVHAALDAGGRGFVDQILGLVEPGRIVTIVDFAAGAKGVNVAAGNPFAIDAHTIAPVLDLAAAGDFATEIAGVVPLADIAEAHRLSERGHLRGKLLVRVADIPGANA